MTYVESFSIITFCSLRTTGFAKLVGPTVPGDAKSIPYKTSKELMNLLSSSDRISQCLTWKIAQFALGRPLGQPDALALENIHNEAKKGGGTYSSVIKAIIKSDLVKKIRTEEANEE